MIADAESPRGTPGAQVAATHDSRSAMQAHETGSSDGRGFVRGTRESRTQPRDSCPTWHRPDDRSGASALHRPDCHARDDLALEDRVDDQLREQDEGRGSHHPAVVDGVLALEARDRE